MRHVTGTAVLGLCAFIALSAPARADIIWNFSYSGTFPNYGPHYDEPDTVTGQLTTTDLNPATDTYTIVAITGMDNGSSITGLDQASYDNLLYAKTPYLDYWGFSFSTAAGDDVNLYYNAASGHYWDWFDSGRTLVENGVFTVSEAPAATPEPASSALLGAGLVLLAMMRRHRHNTSRRA